MRVKAREKRGGGGTGGDRQRKRVPQSNARWQEWPTSQLQQHKGISIVLFRRVWLARVDTQAGTASGGGPWPLVSCQNKKSLYWRRLQASVGQPILLTKRISGPHDQGHTCRQQWRFDWLVNRSPFLMATRFVHINFFHQRHTFIEIYPFESCPIFYRTSLRFVHLYEGEFDKRARSIHLFSLILRDVGSLKSVGNFSTAYWLIIGQIVRIFVREQSCMEIIRRRSMMNLSPFHSFVRFPFRVTN